ncbi:uncharacterized protein TNCV_2504931 [Trichonephila clavipes]|uniref:Uncharacterized protein n=1 Tax=Trichonephila clavipes TaxID=2585209 RepID=A0A8X6WG55_TRICX|nr:uncharacterized protein TNCV_2504931 [Trichonephila clavipes]
MNRSCPHCQKAGLQWRPRISLIAKALFSEVSRFELSPDNSVDVLIDIQDDSSGILPFAVNSITRSYIKEAKTRHRVSLVSAHVTTLEEDLKQQPLCQDSPKDVLSDSGLEIELAIPFVPNRDPPDTPQQSELGEVVHYHPSE